MRKRHPGVLFVCANNICRSPLAEVAFRAAARREGILRNLVIDSAGTRGTHAGERPDARAVRAASERGYDLSRKRARQVKPGDLGRFDWILAMDQANVRDIVALPADSCADHVGLLLDELPSAPVREVPDPYFGSYAQFVHVLDLVEPACAALAARLARVMD
jgi:protein-tyrosine phosphatase